MFICKSKARFKRVKHGNRKEIQKRTFRALALRASYVCISLLHCPFQDGIRACFPRTVNLTAWRVHTADSAIQYPESFGN